MNASPHASRRLLLGAAVALAAPALWRAARAQGRLQPTPSQTEGPFYPVQFPADSDGDLLVLAGRPYARGQAAWLEGTVSDTEGRTLAGAAVEIWQCDPDGRYHHPGDGGRADPGFQGFGRVMLGKDGSYRFRTLRPVAYSGRTPHIHLKVRLGAHELLTTQVYVRGDPGNARDFLWQRLSEADRDALTVAFAPDGAALRARMPIVVRA